MAASLTIIDAEKGRNPDRRLTRGALKALEAVQRNEGSTQYQLGHGFDVLERLRVRGFLYTKKGGRTVYYTTDKGRRRLGLRS